VSVTIDFLSDKRRCLLRKLPPVAQETPFHLRTRTTDKLVASLGTFARSFYSFLSNLAKTHLQPLVSPEIANPEA
jgi:hypothetical protein